MATDFSVRAKLSALDNGFTSTIKKCTSSLESFGDRVKNGIAFGALASAGHQAFSALSSGLSNLMSEAISASDAMEKLQTAMRFSGVDESEIERIAGATGTLKTYADKTVFSLEDVLSTFGALSANGVKDADKLTEAVGNAVAVFGGGANEYSSVALAFSQAMAAGSLKAQDWNQIINASPQLAGGLRKELMKLNPAIASDFKGAMEDGAISADLLAEAINNIGMSEAAKEAAVSTKTIEGAVGNLEAAVQGGLMSLFDTFAKSGLIDIINNLTDRITAGFTWLQTAVPKAISAIQPYWEAFKDAFSGVGSAIGDTIGALKTAFSELFSSVDGASVLDTFKGIMQGLAGAIKWVAGVIKNNAGVIAQLVKWLPAIVIGFKGFGIIKSILPSFTSFGSAAVQVGGNVASAGKELLQGAAAFALMGVGVLAIAAGFWLLSNAAIALSNAGWGAIAVLAGLVAVIALLAVGAAALGAGLTAGAGGFVAFGGAIALVGVGVMLAAAGVVLLSGALPALIQYGLQGMAAMSQLGTGLLVLGAAALVAGAGFIVLGAGLLVCAAAVVIMAAGVLLLGAGMLLIGTGAVMAAQGIGMLAVVLPLLAENALSNAAGLAIISAGLIAFGAAALVAGAGALALGAGLAVIGAALILIGAGITLIGVGAVVAAAAINLLALAFPALSQYGADAAAALTQLGVALTVFGAGALIAGASALVLGAGLLVCAAAVLALAAGVILLGTGLMLVGVGASMAATGLAALNAVLPLLAQNAATNAAGLLITSSALLAFGAAALAAGAGALVLGAGMLVCAAAVLVLSVSIAALGAGLMLVGVGAAMAATGISALAIVLPMLTQNAATNAAGLLITSSALLAFGAAALVAGAGAAALAVGLVAVGAAMIVAAAGCVVLGAAVLVVSTQMTSIARNAKTAERSLASMQKSVNIVQSGLNALGGLAKDAMNALANAFSGGAKEAETSGRELGDGFTQGMNQGLAATPMIALVNVTLIIAMIKAERAQMYAAGAYVSQGFAQGLKSQLYAIRSAANEIAAAADKAVRAKLKIHSPSRVAEESAKYYGLGFIEQLEAMRSKVWTAAQELVSVPQIDTSFSGTYQGELSNNYEYFANADYSIEVPLTVNGKEFARATAAYTQAELNRNQRRDNRKRGNV